MNPAPRRPEAKSEVRQPGATTTHHVGSHLIQHQICSKPHLVHTHTIIATTNSGGHHQVVPCHPRHRRRSPALAGRRRSSWRDHARAACRGHGVRRFLPSRAADPFRKHPDWGRQRGHRRCQPDDRDRHRRRDRVAQTARGRWRLAAAYLLAVCPATVTCAVADVKSRASRVASSSGSDSPCKRVRRLGTVEHTSRGGARTSEHNAPAVPCRR